MLQTIEATRIYKQLADAYDPEKQKKQIKQGFVLEGSGGVAKTWTIAQFLIIEYCQKNKGKDILIARQQYSDLKRSVMKDFFKILEKYKLYEEKHHTRSNPQSYNLFGNKIYFAGLDAMGAHGERHDVIWINEAMEADFESFRQLNQRCNEIFILDYNPIFTQHWIYSSVITRPDVKFLHCPLISLIYENDVFIKSVINNPFLPDGQLDEILAYEPTHPKDRHLPEKERRPHPANITNGTADDISWKVYGLGLRAQHEGVIFRYVNWLTDGLPKEYNYWYGLDWGFTTDPTALVKICVDEARKKIYAQELCYEPIDNAQAVSEMLANLGIGKNIKIIADSSDKYSSDKGTVEMVKELKGMGWNIDKVSKTHDRYYWITKAHEYQINLVMSNHWKIEQENWSWRTVNGMKVNQPIDKFDHLWSAMLYGLMGGIQRPRKLFW